MRGMCTAQVVESRNPDYSVGDLLVGVFGWQDYAVAQGDWSIDKVPEGTPLTWPLSVLGITTLTAYFGLKEIAKPEEGETVAVSGAAGATGSVAAQLRPVVGMPDDRHRGRPREMRVADRRAGSRRRDRLQVRGREGPLARAVPGRDRRVLGQRRGNDPRSGAREPRDARPRRPVRRDRQLQRRQSDRSPQLHEPAREKSAHGGLRGVRLPRRAPPRRSRSSCR